MRTKIIVILNLFQNLSVRDFKFLLYTFRNIFIVNWQNIKKMCFIISGELIMRIPQIKFSIDKNKGFSYLKKSFNRINNLLDDDNKTISLLPDSTCKNKSTCITTNQLIDLVLRNL